MSEPRDFWGVVAVIDGSGHDADVGLYRESIKDGNLTPIEWPSSWPEWVSPAFLKSRGVRVVFA